jgi:hypothetical protein
VYQSPSHIRVLNVQDELTGEPFCRDFPRGYRSCSTLRPRNPEARVSSRKAPQPP